MNLESQVVSLELSKKLKEMGVNQESLFTWVITKEKTTLQDVDAAKMILEFDGTPAILVFAYTVAELGELLPWYIKEIHGGLEYQKHSGFIKNSEHHVLYTLDENTLAIHDKDTVEEFAKTEANARAKMLIYLLENNLTEL